ncbi:Mannose-1-phosphate guanylyltransferase / Mannose-6-phosphate isomerase [hydrothermal vent metagenome]|uniref:Mannose-1-phosphate guanylyltransferase / Mannose-6-phosphate isomerase n=1 Tax=hydrothermal vent metagenome TaxID=652676 RepID=A0A3B0SA69_9ZZZZ
MSKPIIVPVIMSGGAGTRLWPLSRQAAPKQMHAIFGARTLLQETIARVPTDTGFAPPMVVCAQPHIGQVQQQLADIGVQPSQIIAEPMPRNTAPCAMIAALAVAEKFGDEALVLLLAADHFIADPMAFRRAVHLGASTASNGHILTFGPQPTRPETGYGYLLAGKTVADGVFELDSFVEKPDLQTAKNWLKDGRYLWNSGMFLFPAKLMQEQINRHRPAIAKASQQAWKHASRQADNLILDAAAFAQCPAESVDNAVMENTQHGAVIPLDAGWSDVGSWLAIYELAQKDEAGNASTGEVVHLDAKNCLFHANGIRIAAVGVTDLAIVTTKNAVLVLPLDQAQKTKDIVALLDENEL